MSRTIGSPGLDDPIRRLVVRRGGVRARSRRSRTAAVVVALGDEPLADLAGDVGLGPPDQPTGRDLGHDPVGRLGGQSQQRDLVGVLDHPQVAQDRRGELETGRAAQRRLEPQQVARPERVGDGDPRRGVPVGPGRSPATTSYGSSRLVPRHDRRRPCGDRPRRRRAPARHDERRAPAPARPRASSAARAASPRSRSGSAGRGRPPTRIASKPCAAGRPPRRVAGARRSARPGW